MVDIHKHIEYWKKGAFDDFEVALGLVNINKTRHGLFFAHLSLEKILKAQFCQATQTMAPRIHNLVRISEMAGLDLTESQLNLLAEMNEFNLEGRYPVDFIEPMSKEQAQYYITQTQEILIWLSNLL